MRYRNPMHVWFALALSVGLAAGCASTGTQSGGATTRAKGDIIMRVASAQDEDPFRAGEAAAEALKEALDGAEPHALILAECFEEEAQKKQVLAGIATVFPKDILYGGATYGCFTQAGCLDLYGVGLLGIAGDGITVVPAYDPELGIAGLTMEDDEATIAERLRAAGARLAGELAGTPRARLLILIPDAHSPKNQFIVEGAQQVVGKDFPITGGSVNKNAGQTFVYYRGEMASDAAVALLLSGDFTVSLAGRQAKENAKVISTARDGAAEALEGLEGDPIGVLAFNCAGRQGRLDDIEDELLAMQEVLGDEVPLFGCYCAGEIGPADLSEAKPDVLSSGVGWHVMFTILGRN